MLEPKDKLDTKNRNPTASAVGGRATVNGPEGAADVWAMVDWRQAERDVQRLRRRIFAASQAGNLAKVRSLQKLMLRSRSNTLLSVRRVTEINAGKRTAGVDGRVVLTDSGKMRLARNVQHHIKPWHARPLRRVYIPKSNGKRRPLGIPVITDRVLQAQVKNAVEPEWEARFEQKSYGFRPGRGCHDAISAIFMALKGKDAQRLWALDADLTAAFDRLDHAYLLDLLGPVPGRGLIEQWLMAGVIEEGRFVDTERGAPQGGVISPLLLNVALHGIEQAAGVRYHTGARAGFVVTGAPILVRYADDLVALCHSREQAEQVKARLVDWLAPRGLTFNEDKTQLVHVDQDGFDFLGFNVRRYHGKLLIKPSKAAMRRIRERLRSTMRNLRGSNVEAVLGAINPIVRGWSAYYRTVVSKKAFNDLDDYMWRLTYKWAKFSHPKKPRHWITSRYYGAFVASRQDRWVFGDRRTGAYLTKFVWTKIVRHQMVKGAASMDDPALVDYWANRRGRKGLSAVDRATLRLLRMQQGRCSSCGELLLFAEHQPRDLLGWTQWMRATRQAIARRAVTVDAVDGPDEVRFRLLHTSCQPHRDEEQLPGTATRPRPAGLLEPDAL